LLSWFRSLININIIERGSNTVIAANDGNSNLLRLIHKQLPTTYTWHPELFRSLKNFTLYEWRNSTSGMWGPSYSMPDGSMLQVPDLSTTFHIAKYYNEFGFDVGLWPELGQSTVDLVGVPFPWGQFTREGTPFNHNLYDTATLFALAWPASSAASRAAIAAQSRSWLNYTLSILQGDGSWPKTVYDDTEETAQVGICMCEYGHFY
jgi:hypothetical protein